MARTKHTVLSPVEFPILEPEEYLGLAFRHDLGIGQAKQLTGFGEATWKNWLGKTRKPGEIRRAFLEKLYRIAVKQGWINEGRSPKIIE